MNEHNPPVRGITVGRINFHADWRNLPSSTDGNKERIEALALGLGQLSAVLLIIDGRLTEMVKQLDRMEGRTLRPTRYDPKAL